MSEIPKPLIFEDHSFLALDQRKLPHEEVYLRVEDVEGCYAVIRDMVVRGAPLIGFTALYGLVIWAQKTKSLTIKNLEKTCQYLRDARPTAVNLEFELDRVLSVIKERPVILESQNKASEWLKQWADDAVEKLSTDNKSMAEKAELFLNKIFPEKKKFNLMTLCNTGYLACGPIGTALGVVSHLHSKERIEMVYACETRPYLQGARLTSYELAKEEIPYQLLVEGAISSVLEHKDIDAIFVGADRIAANGDTANKVGTSTLAIVASHYGVPVFVVAPTSSFDLKCESGDHIDIEQRPESEVTQIQGIQMAPEEARAFNPSFDITRGPFIKAIFCENGVISPVQKENLVQVVTRLESENV